MQSSDFFAQPSIAFDACPTAVLQAMSSGLVVALSDKIGLRESFVPDREFLLVSGGKEAWIGALEKLKALAPETRRALGSAAREAVIRSFSWSGICAQIEALL
jgi:glycosyltransferase involved in cell wall biosynthesis